MRIKLILLYIFGCVFGAAAQTAAYIGTIDKYKIILELNTSDGKTYTGRYHYNAKDQWIQLKGRTKGLVLYLTEYTGGKTTGLWELVFEDTKATGSWRKSPAAKALKIQLSYMEDGTGINSIEPIVNNLAGYYRLQRKVDNSRFPADYKEDLPFGNLSIEQVSDREIRFDLDYNSGYPDYHLANVSEKAVSFDGGKIYEFNNYITSAGSDQKCKIIFTVKCKDIYISGGTGPECGSGANADPAGLYKKIK